MVYEKWNTKIACYIFKKIDSSFNFFIKKFFFSYLPFFDFSLWIYLHVFLFLFLDTLVILFLIFIQNVVVNEWIAGCNNGFSALKFLNHNRFWKFLNRYMYLFFKQKFWKFDVVLPPKWIFHEKTTNFPKHCWNCRCLTHYLRHSKGDDFVITFVDSCSIMKKCSN